MKKKELEKWMQLHYMDISDLLQKLAEETDILYIIDLETIRIMYIFKHKFISTIFNTFQVCKQNILGIILLKRSIIISCKKVWLTLR